MYLHAYTFLQSVADTAAPVLPNPLVSLGRLFFMLVAFVFVAGLAFYSTRWIASAKFARQTTGNLRIVEQMQIGLQASVQLIEAGEKVLLIGVTKERVSLLCEIPKDGVAIPPTRRQMPTFPFENILNQMISKTDKKR